MKKTIFAVVLLGIAGTVSANDIKVNADIYSGATHVSSYTVIVGDGQTVEVQDKLSLANRENSPGMNAETGAVTDDLQQVTGKVDTGISLKMTPLLLTDGRIVMDAAVSSKTLIKMKQELVNGKMTDNPITRELSYTTQMVVGSAKVGHKWLDTFAPDSGTVWVSFSAAEI